MRSVPLILRPRYKLALGLASRCALVVGLSAGMLGCVPHPVSTLADSQIAAQGTAVPAGGLSRVERLGPNDFRALLPEFQSIGAQQMSGDWCWAASAQMLLRYHFKTLDRSIPVTQDEMVEKLRRVRAAKASGLSNLTLQLCLGRFAPSRQHPFGMSSSADAATLEEIVLVLWPEGTQELIRRCSRSRIDHDFGVSQSGLDRMDGGNGDLLVEEISAGYPVIVGLGEPGTYTSGHALIAYSVRYSSLVPQEVTSFQRTRRNLFGPPQRFAIREVETFDPWDGTVEKKSGDQIRGRVGFMVSARTAVQSLSGYLKGIRTN